MVIRKSHKASQTLLNTVARKLGSAAGTVTRVTRELSQDLLVSSRVGRVRSVTGAGKKAAKRARTKEKAIVRTSKTSTRRGGKPAVLKQSAHRKPSRAARRMRSAVAARKARLR
jgi:hypothetical protein